MSYNNPPALSTGGERLLDRVVLVTGASVGIGAAAVRRFAAEGAKVVAMARRADLLEEVVAAAGQDGAEVVAFAGDVTDEGSVRAAVELAVDRFGRLDAAFNNAGVNGSLRLLHEVEAEDFDRVLAANLRGVFLCMKYEIAQMLETGGSIVNTSSVGGLVGGPMYSDYAAAKFGIAGLVKCAAIEYAKAGIRVNAIAPGPTDTPMIGPWAPTEEARAVLAGMYPMNYIAHPDDMARAALFLLSDESRWTTGTILACDGGFTAQ